MFGEHTELVAFAKIPKVNFVKVQPEDANSVLQGAKHDDPITNLNLVVAERVFSE